MSPALRTTIRDNLRGWRKFLDAPKRNNSRFFFAPFAFFAAILLFGYSSAA
jgi:hypothetical protein